MYGVCQSVISWPKKKLLHITFNRFLQKVLIQLTIFKKWYIKRLKVNLIKWKTLTTTAFIHSHDIIVQIDGLDGLKIKVENNMKLNKDENMPQ